MSCPRVFWALLVYALLFASQDTTADNWTKGRMRLFVFARAIEPSTESEPTARAKQAKGALDAAEAQLKGIQQDLKKRYGGKRDQWPPDAGATFEQASETRRQALYRWFDSSQTQQEVEQWTDALRNIILGKRVEHTARATGPEDALDG
jgi:hypothetical protein